MQSRSFDNQRQAIIAALKELGKPARAMEVSNFLTKSYGITIAAKDCGTLMADMEQVTGKSNYPKIEKILKRLSPGVYTV